MHLSPKNISKGEYSDRGSKFYSFLFPFRKRSALQNLIQSVKKEYPEAKHLCYAFRLGLDQVEELSHDAGEPSHSAGDPILNQLRSNDLYNCLGIVARIYGGTKLGLQNLRDAYSRSIEDSISRAILVEDFERKKFFLEFNYSDQGNVEKITATNQGIILKKEFGASCEYSLEFPEKYAGSAFKAFTDLQHKGLRIDEID